MRAPSPVLVIDAAVLVAAVRGRRSGAILEAADAAALVTTDRVVQKTRRRVELGLKRPDLLAIIDGLAAELTIARVAVLAPLLASSEVALRDAVPRRNESTRDAHVLALAWSVKADVWTTDRDFAGAGVASPSTPNLMRALAEGAQDWR